MRVVELANLALAEQFIRNQGNPVELARLQFLVDGSRPSETVISQLYANQNEDGSWSPFWAPHASSVDATCYRLSQCEQLGLSVTEPSIGRALDFLESRQAPSGYFEEDAALADSAPPWAMPGQMDSRLYLSANAAFWLAFYRGNSASSARAVNYMNDFQEECGKLPSFLNTNWLMSGVWLHLGHTDHADCALQYLQSQLNKLTASDLAWCINALLLMGLSSGCDFTTQCLARLSDLQHADGHWSGEMSEGQDVHTTLECLCAFTRCR